MSYDIYAARHELTAPKFAFNFKRAYGGKIYETYQGGSWAGFGSPNTWDGLQTAISSGEPWLYGDHGYFGRKVFYKITQNAYQHSGVGESDGKRLKAFDVKIKPWRRSGNHIVVCLQSQAHYNMRGIPNWEQDTLLELKKVTDRPIIIRTKRDRKPLQAHLKNAYCIITHTSNSALESILYGVPAICTGQCASSVMSVDSVLKINNLKYPDNRYEWACVLADNQWTMQEIGKGALRERIKII